jgi:diguanylate cyclase (GGDEF)-like protein
MMGVPDWDVFLSYCSKDFGKAEVIRRDLEAAGLTVWYDRTAIDAGRRIRHEIAAGLRCSRLFLILISRYSLGSEWVLNELDAGMLREIETRRLFVLPILVGRVTSTELPPDIRGKKYIDLRYRFELRYMQQRDVIISSLCTTLLSSSKTRSGDADNITHKSQESAGASAEIFATRLSSALLPVLRDEANVDSSATRSERAEGQAFLTTALPTVLAHLRRQRPALFLFDIDGLTAINGRYGVAVGTDVIAMVTKALAEVAEVTYAGRCGDDTFFAVIDRGTDAERLTQRISTLIRDLPWHDIASGLYVTVSGGLAYILEDEDAPEWLIRAVHGMLEAKHRGRGLIAPAPLYVPQEYTRFPGWYFSGWQQEPNW